MFLTSLLGVRLIMKTIPPTGSSHTATVIFFHGSGDTGSNVIEWIQFLLGKDMEFPHIKVLFPTAPLQPYTPLDGQKSNVWFDRASISIDSKEKRASLESISETVKDMINDEVQQGIPENRIVVGGFSMGGALALHTAYHLNRRLAGAFACSSFLNRDSLVYDTLSKRPDPSEKMPELLMFHGDRDCLVPPAWGEETFKTLVKLGVKADFRTVRNTMHELKRKQMMDLNEWIKKILPPTNADDR